MNTETTKFLRSSFSTTQKGVFNIFFAFIEQAMKFLSQDGTLGYIVPNNFFSIRAASDFRDFLQTSRYLYQILDFGDNMAFLPVRTYNCILLLTRKPNEFFDYGKMDKTDDIENGISETAFTRIPVSSLDKNGWKLADEKTRGNLKKIESQHWNIKDSIRSGIATLRDKVYFVKADEAGFYKEIAGEKHYIEDGLVKPIFKIPEIRLYDNIEEAKRYIIFPYLQSDHDYSLIPEQRFKEDYPETYEVLLHCKNELDSRDKGNGHYPCWYAYGRSQGLNKYGRKLLFPTYARHPGFIYMEDENTLFCNGYAVFENDQFDLQLLARILNSEVMDYYIRNTSSMIEGGYYHYLKNPIEKFSIPDLPDKSIDFIRNASDNDLNDYLWNIYTLE